MGPEENGHNPAKDISIFIFIRENIFIIIIALIFEFKGPIENKSLVIQIMA